MLSLGIGFAFLIGAVSASPVSFTCVGYSLEPKDTCQSVSTAYGLNVSQLLEYNPRLNCTNLKTGETICLTKGVTIPFSEVKLPPSNLTTTTSAVTTAHPTTVPAVVRSSGTNSANGDDRVVDHNRVRGLYGSQPLSWSNSLAQSAAVVANQLASKNCDLIHSGWENVGENLYGVYASTQTTIKNAVERWEQEDQSGNEYNHWTQVVWGSTTHVGCSVVPGNSCAVVVCHYSPAGNIVGQLPNGESK